MNMKPRCECRTELRLEIGYTCADWKTKAGRGSGYDYEIALVCPKCGTVYHLGNIKHEEDFSKAIERL
ncbi:hypothetical protein [Youngiibacter multivorans]|uniref:Uncharacterized protein n=1 Tax=Youngiibacter multivorans TaxID=937251 RepID=A0ABS4G9K6_9CLOT|nr:hypothetical protein [Youngiibacter multivorans]MBP1920960.1 hypothetical protein [Youngiibacter multivorans]